MTQRLSKYFKDYASYHRTRGNQITHYFGITFIVVSLLGLLAQCRIESNTFLFHSNYFQVDGGTILLAVSLLWYLFLDWKIAIPFGFVLYGLYFLGRAFPPGFNWTLFVSGWILQFLGHLVFEKKSPAFFKNFTHLLIGPLWIFAKIIGYWKSPSKP